MAGSTLALCLCTGPYRAPCLMQQTRTSMMSGTEHMSTRTTERQAQSLPKSRIRIPTRTVALSTRTTERQAQSLPISRIRKTTRTVALSTRTTERQEKSLPISRNRTRTRTAVNTSTRTTKTSTILAHIEVSAHQLALHALKGSHTAMNTSTRTTERKRNPKNAPNQKLPTSRWEAAGQKT